MRSKKSYDLLKEEKIISHILHDISPQHPDVNKIIVCKDSECSPEEEVEEELKRLEKSVKSKINKDVFFVNVVHALENWLLSDPEGIQEYLGPKVNVTIPSVASKECKPKEVMKDIFRKAGKDFRYTIDNHRIAEIIDTEKIIKSNPSFKKFIEVIKDP